MASCRCWSRRRASFAGLITLGVIVQIRFAYGQVSGALNWFVYAHQEVARWRANVEPLSMFAEVLDAIDQDLKRSQIRVVAAETPALRLTDLRLQTDDGGTLVDAANASVEAGERVAITRPPGSGKTILLRAIAGMWPFGVGRIEVPAPNRTLFVPQRPYFPAGTLRAAVSYPAPEGTFPDERIGEALRALGLDPLTARLDDRAPWDQQLSPHEQQRLAIACVLLNEPEWLFLDKATSELDEESERRVYELLAARLPHTTVISVAHRPAAAYHARRWTIVPKEHGPPSLQAA